MSRIEVEELSETRWARIEQSLIERLEGVPLGPREPDAVPPRKGAGPRVIVGAFAAAIAIAAAVALFIALPSAHVSTSRVATEASPSHVTMGDASIDLSPESGIVVREEEHATVLVLERGEVALHVAPRPKDRPFLVEAGEVHVRVVGTEFSVRRAGVGAVVTVRRGIVEVTAHGELARLKAGDAWPDVTVTPVADTAGATGGVTGGATVNGAALLPGPDPVSTSASAGTRKDVTSARAPIAAGRSTGSRPLTGGSGVAHTATNGGPAPAPASETLAPPGLAVAPAAAAASPQDLLPSPPASPSSQAQYEAAEQIERKDPDSALRAYTTLARGSDAWAQDALFAAGRLQADRGARADAIRLLEEYLRRFPRGSNAQDARTLREALR